jgi:hypothetical protein
MSRQISGVTYARSVRLIVAGMLVWGLSHTALPAEEADGPDGKAGKNAAPEKKPVPQSSTGTAQSDKANSAAVPAQPGSRHKLELYAGADVNGKPYPMGPEGYQGNYYNSGSDGFGQTTMGISHTFASFDPETKAYLSAYYDCGAMFYFNVSAIPKGAKILSAKLGLSATNPKTEYGNHPTGRERIPLKPILNIPGYPEIWEMAHLKEGLTDTKEENWDGASWRYWNEAKKQPWSQAPSQSNVPKGRKGDLSTAMGETAGYISFVADGKSMSYSDDLKELVQAWVDGTKRNWGLVADLQHCESPDRFGLGSGEGHGQKKFRVRAGVLTGYNPDAAKRPRLIIEWEMQ